MRTQTTLLLTLATALPAAAQTGTLDQDSPFHNVSFNGSLTNWDRAQAIAVGFSGQLEGITFEVYGIPPAASTVNIYGPTNTQQAPNGAPAASFQLYGQGGGWVQTFVDMTAANILVNPGEFWCVEIVGGPGGVDFKGNEGLTALYPYEFFETAGTTAYQPGPPNMRIGLQTWIVPYVPAPTVAWNGGCPGPGTLALSNFTPGGLVGVGVGTGTGALTLPGGACAGTVVGITQAQVKAVLAVDAQGSLSYPAALPSAACGRYLQALDLTSCELSNVLSL